MSELRYFTEDGRKAWLSWLENLKLDPLKAFPDALLTNPDITRRAPGEATIEQKYFASRLELAEYVASKVEMVRKARLPSAFWPGVWDWLAALFFDSICGTAPDGRRKVRELVRYSYNSDFRKRYRHRIAGPVELFMRMGIGSRCILYGGASEISDLEEQARSRNLTTSYAGIGAALDALYWDIRKERPKTGIAPNWNKPGTLRRFDALLKQLYRTYDLASIDSDQLLTLLPKEFDRYNPRKES